MFLSRLPKSLRIGLITSCLAASMSAHPVAAAPGDAPTTLATQQVRVGSLSDLYRALQRANRATEILVAPGQYKGLSVRGMTVPEGTVIKSASAARPAVFEGLFIDSVRGLAVENVIVASPTRGPVNGRYGALVISSRDIRLEGIQIFGPGRKIDRRFISAIMLRGSSDITLAKSYFTNFRHGLTLLDIDNSLIENNEFERLQTDGIRGGGVQNTTIRANVITDFQPSATDHPDGIQLWSTNQKEAGRNITISDNLIVRGNGGATQGIFIRDTRLKLPFQSLSIDGNLVVGGRYNGISVGGANGLKVSDNMVIPRGDQKSWIRLEATSNAVAVDNTAGTFVFRNNRQEPRSRGNTTIEATDRNLASTISRWAREKEAFSSFRGPVLQRLMRTGA